MNHMIDEAQAGFRKGHSTTDNLFCLQAMAQKYLSRKGGCFYCLYVDFAKAFDTIDHAKLLSCLADRGVGGKLLRILKSMYLSYIHVYRPVGTVQSLFRSNVGTRQECILSLVLFSLFINEVITDIRSVQPRYIYFPRDP